MSKKGKLISAGISGILFFVLLALIIFVDVAKIGPEGTSVGLSRLNKAVFDTVGENKLWYDITECIGKFAICVAAVFAVIGLVQLIKRKSLLKLDREIYALCGIYAAFVVIYLFFEKVIINYRPVITDGVVEASFPSSHTMLVCTVLGSAMIVLDNFIKNKKISQAVKVILGIIIALTVIGRLISGVHWFTDILGGVLISISLLFIFSAIVGKKEKTE